MQTRLKALGPGLVWAGTAIGVSHLVQSTLAGASYGLALLLLVLLANLCKYPAYEAGPRYAAATQTSLLAGYQKRGDWLLYLFLALTVSTMFTVIAAVTFVAAGMASALITDAIPTWGWSGILLLLTAAMLVVGRFALLERFMTAMMLLLAASTVLSVVLLVPTTDFAAIPLGPLFPPFERHHLIFVAGLVGWMPSALDTAVWHGLWGLEKAAAQGHPLDPDDARFDFDVGYIGTALLAAMFLFMGASVLYGSEREIPASSVAFASMLVDAYTTALGEWSRPLILVAAFSTMLSTTVAVTEGFPRALEGAVQQLRTGAVVPGHRTRVYWASLAVCIVVAQLICVWFTGQLKPLIQLATGLTGVTAPFFAMLNLAALRGDEVPESLRPSGLFLGFHLAGIAFLWAMALLYLYAQFVA